MNIDCTLHDGTGVHESKSNHCIAHIIAEWFLNHRRFWPIRSQHTTRLDHQIATLLFIFVFRSLACFSFSLIRFHLCGAWLLRLSCCSQSYLYTYIFKPFVSLHVVVFALFFLHSFLLLLLWFSDFLHLDRLFSSVILGGPIEMPLWPFFALLLLFST